MPAKKSKAVEDRAIALYKSGMDVTDIPNHVDCSLRTLYDILDRREVEKRRPNAEVFKKLPGETTKEYQERIQTLRAALAQRYDEGQTATDVAEEFNVDLQAVLTAIEKSDDVEMRDRGIDRREYDVDESFFNTIDTEEKAYWLGFLTADGYVGENEITLALSIRDRGHVEAFRDALSSEHNIREVDPKTTEMKDGRTIQSGAKARIDIYSKRLVEALRERGLHRDKSLTATKPKGIPGSLERHFWRGVVDGDGSIGPNGDRYWQIQVTGTRDILDELSVFVSRELDTPEATPRKSDRGEHYSLKWSGIGRPQDVTCLLYEDAEVYLPRKKDKVDKLLEATYERKRTS